MKTDVVDLTEALEAASTAYIKHHWLPTPNLPNATILGSPNAFEKYKIGQALLPLIVAAEPFITAQCSEDISRLTAMMRTQAQTLTEERNVARRALVTLGLAIARVTALCEDPGGPDSWSHTFEGRSSIFVDDVLDALTTVAKDVKEM